MSILFQSTFYDKIYKYTHYTDNINFDLCRFHRHVTFWYRIIIGGKYTLKYEYYFKYVYGNKIMKLY